MSDAEPAETWKVQVTARNEGFRRLPEKAAAAIVEFVTGTLADDPYRLSKPLMDEQPGLRTARRGDYRGLFGQDTEGHVL